MAAFGFPSDTLGPSAHEIAPVVAKSQGILSKGQRSVLSPQIANDRRPSNGLGSAHHRTSQWRKSEQVFTCHGAAGEGQPPLDESEDACCTHLRLKMFTLMWITAVLCAEIGDSIKVIDVNQPNPVITAAVGENVTLECFRLGEDNTDAMFWYKQKVGHRPRVMVTVQQESHYEDEFKSPRFSIEKEKSSCHLKISNVEPSDEAMYYCGFRQFFTKFGNGTFLAVTGDKDVKVSVSQSGRLDPVPAGASVTLQCSVLSESRAAELQVLWFRAAPPQSHPQIIYTHHNSSHQCESGSFTHTCVYNFSKNILSLSDTGTYYCAVAACGKIILGNGTRVQLGENSKT
ncbi:uncharacterized protein LOC128531801 [Clarias gariepinus]|uniref:uncharacterized protein LOC128531801 n=1 Tax=Clarias gariepinus TaxID=13013 RepID=UPI00234D7DE1|nr:uncharacterized protein LOC128531801 [Clarias gariepinus]